MANILIVDDSSTMRKIISRSLRQAGLTIEEILEGGDGIEGLNVLQTSGKKVDLILSDINMPNMDGLEFVKAVRANGFSMPIVMITSFCMIAHRPEPGPSLPHRRRTAG